MNIKTVKLRTNGLHGAEVHYFIEEVKNNRTVMTLIKKYPKDPIHKDLENLFKDLRAHILDLSEITSAMDESQIKFTVLETSVTGADFDSDGFTIHGYKETRGDKKLPLNPPKVEELDNYDKFQEVMDIMRSIALETKQYLEGSKKVSDLELTERWIAAGKDKSMDMDTFKGLTAEEQRDFCTKFLEHQYGSVVITPENDLTGMDNTEAIEEMETEFKVNMDGEETIVPVKDKKGKKKESVPAAHSPEEEF